MFRVDFTQLLVIIIKQRSPSHATARHSSRAKYNVVFIMRERRKLNGQKQTFRGFAALIPSSIRALAKMNDFQAVLFTWSKLPCLLDKGGG